MDKIKVKITTIIKNQAYSLEIFENGKIIGKATFEDEGDVMYHAKCQAEKVLRLTNNNVHVYKDGKEITVLKPSATVEITLTDMENEKNPFNSLNVRIVACNQGIYLYPTGYGEHDAINGEGSPLFIELAKNELRAVTCVDINQDTAQIISLEGAKEIHRIGE